MSAPEQGKEDFAAVVAAVAGASQWLYADEIRNRLKLLFGIDLSSQQVVGKLGRMAREDAPRFERKRDSWGREWQYRVTRWGANEVENKMPNLRVRERAS